MSAVRTLPAALATSCLLVLATLLFGASAVAGQVLSGVVVEDGRNTPVAGAAVSLLDAAGSHAASTIADSLGRFYIEAGAGDYVLEASRLGYATTRSPRFTIDRDDRLTLEVVLTPAPLDLEGLEVAVEREAAEALRGFGLTPGALQDRWIGRQQIERKVGATGPRDLIRGQNVAGLSLPHNPHALCVKFQRGQGCALNVLNGIEITHGQAVDMDPTSLHAIALLTPAEATLFYGSKGNGGAVLMWTRPTGL